MAKILVVEDEIPTQQLVREVLEREGYEVVAVSTGGEAIAALKAEKPDLLILDVMLPGVDGYSLQTEISRDKDFSGLKVVVVTAQDSFLGLFSKFEQVVATLRKPYQIAQLREVVRKALG